MIALDISCPRTRSPFGHQAGEALLQQQLHLSDGPAAGAIGTCHALLVRG